MMVLRFHITRQEAVVAAPPAEPERVVEPWKNEPQDLSELLDNYIVENKIPAGIAGGMLYLTRAETRSGEKVDLTGEQKNKLFFVT